MKPDILGRLLGTAALLVFGSLCLTGLSRAGGTVPSYWLWAGLTESDLPPAPDATLYLYQGLIAKRDGKVEFHHKGIYAYPIRRGHIHLVFRVDRTVEPEAVAALHAQAVNAWAAHGAQVEGLQVDSDWPTAKLDAYADYLEKLRSLLPKDQLLSATGLGDWAIHGDPVALHRIAGVTDGVAFQLYRGRKPLPFAADYADRLARLDYPFRLGLLSHQQDDLIARVQRNPYYLGAVYFLQK